MIRPDKRWFGVLSAILLALAVFCSPEDKAGPDEPLELAVCGWDSVFVLRLDSPMDKAGRIVWSWCAADAPELPDSMKSKFASTDECKPVNGGRAILITSSSDGVALVERETKKVLFWASAVNAHSADLLPDGMVAVAASHRPDSPGDRLILFAPGTPGREIANYELSWAHGVVWDDFRRKLYALGDDVVVVYKLVHGGISGLEEVERIILPDLGGHDLYPVPGLSILTISTANHCWVLDRNSGRLSTHTNRLAEMANIKCISVSPKTAQTAYIQAEGDDWWATRIRMLDPINTVLMPERRIYKVRWF